MADFDMSFEDRMAQELREYAAEGAFDNADTATDGPSKREIYERIAADCCTVAAAHPALSVADGGAAPGRRQGVVQLSLPMPSFIQTPEVKALLSRCTDAADLVGFAAVGDALVISFVVENVWTDGGLI